jgi:hypothetical protein
MYKRIISVMIEALENIYKYSDQYQSDPHVSKKYLPQFLLGRNNGKYEIRVSNPVKLEHAESLKEKLDLVNTISHDDLKILYRHTITNGKFTAKGGAGLGIIEMAKISGNPLQYSFTPINGNFFEYSLIISFS